MVDISPMILASALANLSPTRLTSGGDWPSIMAKADSARERQLARFWSVQSMEASRPSLLIYLLGSRGASGELVLKVTQRLNKVSPLLQNDGSSPSCTLLPMKALA